MTNYSEADLVGRLVVARSISGVDLLLLNLGIKRFESEVLDDW